MKKEAIIYMADGEMREHGALVEPYNDDMIENQLKQTSWMKRWLRDQGYVVKVFHADQLDTVIKGINEKTENNLNDIMAEIDISSIIIDPLVAAEFNPMMAVCQRCGNYWVKRSMSRPGQCPQCGSRVWDRPRGKNEPGPKPRER